MVMQEDAVVSVPFEGKRPEHNSTSFDLKEKSSIEKDDYEKGDAYEKGGDEVMSIHEAQDTVIENDGSPFPVDPNMPVETHQITVRALLVGVALGFVVCPFLFEPDAFSGNKLIVLLQVGASNVYLGLKTGFTFGASLFGSILGYAILKPLSRVLPEKLGGGYFGPKETVCIQSTASAAGGLSGKLHFLRPFKFRQLRLQYHARSFCCRRSRYGATRLDRSHRFDAQSDRSVLFHRLLWFYLCMSA